jgi:hypothetical protein
MKKYMIITIIILLIILLAVIMLRVLNSGEDNWIREPNGIYVKHGNPSSIPKEVREQRKIINCANNLFNESKGKINFQSQCLGKCDNYSIDIVNNPRTNEDNLIENQCEDYRNKITNHFLELDKNGNLIRIV